MAPINLIGSACCDVGQAAVRIVDQQKVDVLALQAVVVVPPVGVDERDLVLTAICDDFLGASLAWSVSSESLARAWV